MRIKVWDVLTVSGLLLMIGTVGAADMGAIGSTQIVVQILLGIGLIVLAYRWFLAACDRAYKKRWEEYGKR